MGDSSLSRESLLREVSDLLTRRGFSITQTDADYQLAVDYEGKSVDRSSTTVVASSGGSSVTSILPYMIVGNTFIPNILFRSQNYQSTVSSSEAHRVTLNRVSIHLAKGSSIWQGNDYWESETPFSLQEVLFAIHILLTKLPHDRDLIPTVPSVKPTHVDNFYHIHMQGRSFFCPALPYSVIGFADYNSFPVSPGTAMAAYLDLLTNAEESLPTGSTLSSDSPSNPDIWKSAKIGGKYHVGSDGEVVNVIVSLSPSPDGYYIDQASVVSDADYSAFQEALQKWEAIISAYYDVYQ
jgi:hypothetical protein